jgi:DNA-binding Lrp family transcriptional regulator
MAAKAAVREEMRRKRREQRVVDMNAQVQQQTRNGGAHDQMQRLARAGEEVVQKLDDALGNLNIKDRTAVTLRYLQERPMREVAEIMGISEPAASKRVTRAVTRLRGILLRRGIDIAPTVLVAVLEQQAQIAAPPQLTAQATAQAALHAAATSATAAIAKAALAGAVRKWVVAISATGSLLIAVAVTVTASHRTGDGSYPYNAALSPRSVATQAAKLPVTAGFYISLRTAERRDLGRRAWSDQFELIGKLGANSRLDCVPVVEPNSIADRELASKLTHYFPGEIPLEVTDVSALNRLQVLIASEIHHPPDEALEAIEQAVRGGMGLVVRQCLGGDDSGYAKRMVRNLRLFSEAEPDVVRATGIGQAIVVGEHPLLGTLSGQSNMTIDVATFGAGYGRLLNTAAPLLRMKDLSAVTYDKLGPITEKPGYGIYPLAAGQLGAGRIVSCSFESNGPPLELENAVGGAFHLRAVLWAAGQPLE